MRLLNLTEINDKNIRDKAYRAILYIAQGTIRIFHFTLKLSFFFFKGNFGECDTIDEYNQNLVQNIVLLYECDTFNTFVDLLYFEVE